MKSKLILGIVILALALPLMAAPPAPTKNPAPPAAQILDTRSWINANKLLMFVGNLGNFAYDAGKYFGKNDGLYYPFTDTSAIRSGRNDKTAIFDAGIWLGGRDVNTDDHLVAIAEYSTEYVPGPMADSTFQADQPQFRVFKLYSDSLWNNPNADYRDYVQYALPMGAPDTAAFDTTFYFDSVAGAFTDSVVKVDTLPGFPGDQFLWTVYNDADPSAHISNNGSTDPLGIEVQQSTFAFSSTGSLGNIVFLKFKLINKGPRHLDSVYVSIWSDPDNGEAGNDLVGVDTARQIGVNAGTGEPLIVDNLGFCYNSGVDNVYGVAGPAVGYDFFQGPLDSTGNPADTAIMWGKYWPGNRNLPMSSFNKYINGTDPQSSVQAYNYMKGLNPDGTPYTYQGHELRYFNSGDPVAGTGDLDQSPSDRRLMLTTGPFTFNPGDSTEVVCAIIVGQGNNALSSISVLRTLDVSAQKTYNNFFKPPRPPAAPIVTVVPGDQQILLKWTDLSEIQHGDYPFEGYTVLQSADPASGIWDTLAFFDVKNGISVVTDFFFDLNAGKDVERTVKVGTDEGVQRFINITQDKLTNGPLHNYTQYYYRVEAYSVDTTKPSGEKTLTSATVVTATPQPAIPGTVFSGVFADTLADSLITHVGPSALGHIQVLIVDPNLLTGDDYQVKFNDSGWFVIDLTKGDTVVPFWSNQSNAQGPGNYPIVDGMMIKVFGPAPDFSMFTTVANAAGPIDPPMSAAAGDGFAEPLFPTPLDSAGLPTSPTTDQQTTGQRWLIHTADNGGTCGGGDRNNYTAFVSRTTRDGENWPLIIPYDYEMRFTGSVDNPGVGGSYGAEVFGDGSTIWVPFELWNIGIGTPNDPSDDYQMVPWVLDDGEDNTFNLESWGDTINGGGDLEHSVSGGCNDPYTDWVYWATPADKTPGTAGYDAAKALMLAGTYTGENETEVMARMVLVAWNGGTEPPFAVPMVEQGTIFRIETAKPNGPQDVYTFKGQVAPKLAKSEAALARIKAVPNPYYLFSSYDNDIFRRQIRFTNLPEKCTITIYNLAGDKVAVVDKNSTDTWVPWDVQNQNGIPVASGLYIYVVDAPGYGQKIGKVAVFIEEEQLKTY